MENLSFTLRRLYRLVRVTVARGVTRLSRLVRSLRGDARVQTLCHICPVGGMRREARETRRALRRARARGACPAAGQPDSSPPVSRRLLLWVGATMLVVLLLLWRLPAVGA